MPNGLPALRMPQMPNIAATIMSSGRPSAGGGNAAAVRMEELKYKKKSDERKQMIDVNDYALNLLTGVNSEEDLQIAKGQFIARYPEAKGLIDQQLPSYSPRAIEIIRNSLRTETQRFKSEEKEGELKGFGAGTQVYKGGEPKGEQVPFAPPKPSYDVFEEGIGGNQMYIKHGDEIPEGYRKLKGTSGVTIQTGQQGLGKTTKTMLEKNIIEGTKNIQSFRETGKLFKREYLTVFGKGNRMAAGAADKLGLSTKSQKTLIRERSKWFRQAKADFIAFRKWATGVAGGEKEMAEIATAFPDPVKNSPEQYLANLDNIEETTKRVLMLNVDFLRSGIDMEQPLDKIIEQAKKVGIKTPPGVGGTSKTATPGTVLRFNKQGELIQ